MPLFAGGKRSTAWFVNQSVRYHGLGKTDPILFLLTAEAGEITASGNLTVHAKVAKQFELLVIYHLSLRISQKQVTVVVILLCKRWTVNIDCLFQVHKFQPHLRGIHNQG